MSFRDCLSPFCLAQVDASESVCVNGTFDLGNANPDAVLIFDNLAKYMELVKFYSVLLFVILFGLRALMHLLRWFNLPNLGSTLNYIKAPRYTETIYGILFFIGGAVYGILLLATKNKNLESNTLKLKGANADPNLVYSFELIKAIWICAMGALMVCFGADKLSIDSLNTWRGNIVIFIGIIFFMAQSSANGAPQKVNDTSGVALILFVMGGLFYQFTQATENFKHAHRWIGHHYEAIFSPNGNPMYAQLNTAFSGKKTKRLRFLQSSSTKGVQFTRAGILFLTEICIVVGSILFFDGKAKDRKYLNYVQIDDSSAQYYWIVLFAVVLGFLVWGWCVYLLFFLGNSCKCDDEDHYSEVEEAKPVSLRHTAVVARITDPVVMQALMNDGIYDETREEDERSNI